MSPYVPRPDVISYEEFRIVLAKERDGQYSSAVIASSVGESPDKNRFAMPFKPGRSSRHCRPGCASRSSAADWPVTPSTR